MKNVLITEDNPVDEKIITTILEEENYIIHIARNGREAVSKAKEINPDLIILDVIIPFMDGFEVYERIKFNPGLSETPVIFVTALDDKTSRKQGESLGAKAFISKPFDPNELLTVVKEILG